MGAVLAASSNCAVVSVQVFHLFPPASYLQKKIHAAAISGYFSISRGEHGIEKIIEK